MRCLPSNIKWRTFSTLNFGPDKGNLEPGAVSPVYQEYGPRSRPRRVLQALVSPERLLEEWIESSRLADGGGDLTKDLLKTMVKGQNVQGETHIGVYCVREA